MKQTLVLFVVASFLLVSTNGSLCAANTAISFNPRDDYTFGVGTQGGGALGIVGVTADFNYYSLVNAGIGVGSGIYYDTYVIHAKYLILDQPFTPYLGGGFAYWDSIDNGKDLANNSSEAVKLGLVSEDGTDLKAGITIFPIAIGIHYMSDLGLAIYAEADLLFSLSNGHAAPYGALGVGWYF